MERESTIRILFKDDRIQFSIPSYQRAYSWEKDKQINQFITDLKEQPPNKKYFLGHFLFEKPEFSEYEYLVIDGQQRLTTIIIFFSCLLSILEEREKNEGKIIDSDGVTVDLWRIEEHYLKIKNRRKFLTVSYDDNFFENLIINGPDKITDNITDTTSKKRIKDAWKYLHESLTNESTIKILHWKTIIEDAVITTFEVADKIRATQIFAFQNDRGKDLTELEKLKAYLMYQVYLDSTDQYPINAIKYVENEFSDIYKQIERITTLDEDQILGHYNTAFVKGWLQPLDNIKK
jgi:uncharacterized protein with ParB-like and HNH nuclease domain